MSLNPFKRKSLKSRPASTQTLQEMQGDFNQLLFEVGDLSYRKTMVATELKRIESDIASRVQKLDKLGEEAKVVRARIQEEIAQKVDEGKKAEKTDDTSTAK